MKLIVKKQEINWIERLKIKVNQKKYSTIKVIEQEKPPFIAILDEYGYYFTPMTK